MVLRFVALPLNRVRIVFLIVVCTCQKNNSERFRPPVTEVGQISSSFVNFGRSRQSRLWQAQQVFERIWWSLTKSDR